MRLARSALVAIAVAAAIIGPGAVPCVGEPPATATGEIRGIVFDADGKPAGGTPVDAVPEREIPAGGDSLSSTLFAGPAASEPPTCVATEPDGTFVLRGLTLHRRYRVTARPAAPLVSASRTERARLDAPRSVGLRLVRGGPLRVRVTGPDGRGIAARVSLRRDDGLVTWHDEEDRWDLKDVEIPADGATLPAVPDGSMLVRGVVADGSAFSTVVLLPVQGVLTLSASESGGGAVQGTVRDDAGQGVAGVLLVWACDRGDDCLRSARTSVDGRYRMDGVRGGRASLERVSATGLRLGPGESLRWSELRVPANGVVTADVRLSRAASIRGHVRTADGAPVAGATVTADVERTIPAIRTSTASDGSYVLPDVPLGQGMVVVEGLDPAVPPRTPLSDRLQGASSPFVLSAPGEDLILDFAVKAARSSPLEGVVVDGEGRAVPGAAVTAERRLRSWDPLPTATVLTDGAGRFSIPPPSPYPEWGLTARHGERVSSEETARVGGRDVTLRLRRSSSLSGRVVGADDRPLSEVEVTPCQEPHFCCGGYSGPEPVGASVVTDAAGEFALRDVPGGWTTLQLRRRGAWLHPVQGVDGIFDRSPGGYDVKDGEDLRDLVVRAAATGAVGGTAVDEHGAPLAGAAVDLRRAESGVGWIRSARVTTDAQGRFLASDLMEGNYVVRLEEDAFSDRDAADENPPTHPTGTLDVRLQRRAPIAPLLRSFTGTVLGPDGSPVPVARLTLWGAALAAGSSEVVTDGAFAIEVEPRDGDPFCLSVSGGFDASGRAIEADEERVIVPLTRVEPIVIRLHAPEYVTGRVVDPEGRGVSGIVVQMVSPSTIPAFRTFEDDAPLQGDWGLTRDDGSFRFEKPSGSRALRCRPQGDWVEPERIAFDGVRGVPLPELRIVLRRGRSVAGRVLDVEGRGAEAVVAATWEGASDADTPRGVTGADGSFRLVVPEDADRVVVRAREGRGGVPDVLPGRGFAVAKDVVPGTSDLVLRLAMPASVRGAVAGPAGEPITKGWVMLLPEPDDPPRDATRAGPYGWIQEGRFEISAVPDGARRLMVIPESDEYAPSALVSAQVPGDEVQIVVPRSVEVAGEVEGPAPSRLQVTWRGAAADGTTLWRVARVLEGGKFVLRLPPAGDGVLYAASYEKDDDRCAVVEHVSAATAAIRVRLEEGLSLSGSVEGLHSGEAAQAIVVLRGPKVHMSVGLGADARFVAHGLPPGKYEISVEVPDGFDFGEPDEPARFAAGSRDVVVKTGIRRGRRR